MITKGLYKNKSTGEMVTVTGRMEVETYPPKPFVIVVDSRNNVREIMEDVFSKNYDAVIEKPKYF